MIFFPDPTGPYSIPTKMSSDNLSKDMFTSIPLELRIKILSVCFVADIFSFMRVCCDNYEGARVALIEKARLLGYQKSSRLENYEDAAKYIKQIFFRFTHQKVRCFFVTQYRSSRKAVMNEENFLSTPRLSEVEKFTFLSKLEHSSRTKNIQALVSDPEPYYFKINKRYLYYFCLHFFGYKLSPKAFDCFSFNIQPQRVFQKFSLFGLLAGILGNDVSLFSHIFKHKNQALGLDLSPKFYQDVVDADGNNLMHMAAFFGCLSIISAMFSFESGNSARICLQTKNKNNKTPFDLALSQGHKKLVQYLFSKSEGMPNLDYDSLSLFITQHGIELETSDGLKKLLDYFPTDRKEVYAQDIVKALNKLPESQIEVSDDLKKVYIKEAVIQNHACLVNLWSKSVNAIDRRGKTLLEACLDDNRIHMIIKLILLGHHLDDPKLVSLAAKEKEVRRSLVRGGANLSGLKKKSVFVC